MNDLHTTADTQEPLHTVASLSYKLPSQLIANEPSNPRDASRLLFLDKVTGSIKDSHFSSLTDFLREGDVLVRNTSKVIPARLFGIKPTGGRIEVLLNRLVEPSTNTWECLLRPGAKQGTEVQFPNNVSGIIIDTMQDSFTFLIRFNCSIEHFYSYLTDSGNTPLPPYLSHTDQHSESYWRSVYQTTYANTQGSVAAPTAGLHFTPHLDELIKAKGVSIEEVILHVGLGTFAPIKSDDYRNHQLHHEDFELPVATANRINQAKREGRRIIAVGTTTVRVLEHCATSNRHQSIDKSADTIKPINDYLLHPQRGSTDIFIYPPFKFNIVDGLITNFHLPETSLLLLVSAFVSQPNTPATFTTFMDSSVGKAYQHAITHRYRFFSFGDAMFIV